MSEQVDATNCEDLPSYNFEFEIHVPDGVHPPVGEFMALVNSSGQRTIVKILGKREKDGKTILLVKRKTD